MNKFDLALKEFFDNGGKVEVLPYRGKADSAAVAYKSNKVQRVAVEKPNVNTVEEDFEGTELD